MKKETRKIKYKIMQDLSYSETSKESPISINSRINMDQYPGERVYGWSPTYYTTLHRGAKACLLVAPQDYLHRENAGAMVPITP